MNGNIAPPGFNLPLGSLMRSVYDAYPEYHNSLDNRDLISFPAMAETVRAYADILRQIELIAFIAISSHTVRCNSANAACTPALEIFRKGWIRFRRCYGC